MPDEIGNLDQLSNLSLQSNSLSGSIPSELGKLANLTYLSLYDNSLSGSIPPELGDLANLTTLFLDTNSLSGPIPSELSDLTKLNSFWVMDTKVCLPSNATALNVWYVGIGDRRPISLPDCVSPAAPTSLAAADVQSFPNAVTLSWDAADNSTIEHWQVRWKTDGDFGDWTDVPDSDEDTTSHTVTGLTTGVSHTFEVRAVNAIGDGAASSTVATPPGHSLVTDKAALQALYNATDGVNWTNKTGWDFSQPLTSSWHGVTVIGGRVTELNLSGQVSNGTLSRGGLSGTLPVEIGNLNQLTRLDLSFSSLSGSIPSGLGDLTNLERLDLSFNSLSGSIPSELDDLANLESLILSSNSLSGSIPTGLGDLTNLERLDLSSNSLSGSIPTELGSLSALERLDLSSNSLSGSIPTELGSLSALERLDLSSNSLSGSIPTELGSLSALERLDLSSNSLSGSIPTELDGLSALERLDLSGNSLGGSIPAGLGDLLALERLDLAANSLSGSIPTELGDLANLTTLDLSSNSLSGSTPAELGELSKLEILNVSSNSLSGSIPSELGDLSKLEILNFSSNSLSGSIPSKLGQLSMLARLDLSFNSLSGSMPSELGDLSMLARLDLSFNSLSGTIPSDFFNLRGNLVGLDLSSNYLRGPIASTLGYLGYFRVNDTKLCLPSTWPVKSWYQGIGQRSPHSLPDCVVPVAPSSLAADVQSATNAVVLSWDDADNVSIERWQVRWKTDGDFGDWTDVPESDENTTSHTVDGLTPGVSHTFEVRAVNATGNGDASSVTTTLENANLTTDKAALKALYNATNGDNWTNNTGWDFTQPLTSSWHGVTVANGRVTELDLSGENIDGTVNRGGLSGSLPVELGNLDQLTRLDLSNNGLKGSIPSELGDLSNLNVLNLSSNLFGGSIPAELGDLSNLNVLDLSSTLLSGTIPAELGDLSNLKIVNLFGNSLNGSIPTEFGDLSRLESLVLRANSLSGSIPTEFGDLSELKTLDLSYNRLSGSIPTEFGDLSRLESLVLRRNSLVGSIPSELGKLSNLESLDLYSNDLSGSIPAELGDLSDLKLLDLSFNDLSGSIPPELGDLSRLGSLDLHVNDLSGSIPSELGKLSNLESLSLSGNSLSGSIPSELGDLSSLESLSLSNNSLSGSIPSALGYLSKLERLYLQYNYRLSGSIPSRLSDLSKLEQISVDGTKVCLPLNDSTLTTWFGSIKQRKPVSLPYCVLPVAPIALQAHVQRIPEAVVLSWVAADDITREGWQLRWKTDGGFGDWSDILARGHRKTRSHTVGGLAVSVSHTFEVRAVNATGYGVASSVTATPQDASLATDKSALFYADWTKSWRWPFSTPLDSSWYGVTVDNDRLTELDLSGDMTNGTVNRGGLSGSLPVELGNLDQLTRLVLSYNRLSGSIPSELGDLSNLERLALSGNYLSGSIPALGDLSDLKVLDLSSNSLSGSIPTELGDLSNLESLVLSGNSLSGSIPTELGDLSNLERLALSGNSLSGSIPTELGDLSKLESLDLSGNSLNGSIPSWLGDLSNLKELNLSGTSLVGSIPTELDGLSKLESLDLSGNSLNGSIPSWLGDLSNLKELNLSGTSLVGSIPTELDGLSNLESLDLSGNSLNGSIPSWLGDLSNLKELNLSGTSLSGSIPTDFDDLSNLNYFYVDSPVCLPTNDASLTTWYGNIEERNPSPLPDCIPPAAPTSLSADVQSAANSVTLSWTSADDDTIERWQSRWKTDGEFGDWMDVPQSDADTTSHTVTGLTSNILHTFEVRAVNATGNGAASSATATPEPGTYYDTDDDGLIEISNLAQLNAIRWDVDGDGAVIDASDSIRYSIAFPDAKPGMGCPSTGCKGYELKVDLDFDTNGDGMTNQPMPKDGTTGCVVDTNGKWPNDHADCDYDDYWNNGNGWEQIGWSDNKFATTFDGNGHTISNLYVNRDASTRGAYAALFANTDTASVIKNVGLVDVDITGSQSDTGAIAGLLRGTLSNSFATGEVEGVTYVGGLVGQLVGTITGSYAMVDADGDRDVGGLVGRTNRGTVASSYATGKVEGDDNIGGLVGYHGGVITNSYSIGVVVGTSDPVDDTSDVGGLVGYNFQSSPINDSYWYPKTSHQNGGNGKTTSELKTPTDASGIFAKWGGDDSPWDFGTPGQYPALKADWDGDEVPTVEEFGEQRTNAAPTVANEIEDKSVERGKSLTISLEADDAPVFTDEDLEEITFSAESTNTTVATVAISDSALTVTGKELGTSDVTVTATDARGKSTTDTFTVTVTLQDYDDDDNGLIEISNLAQLNAIRWDLDGDAAVDDDGDPQAYAAAFPDAQTGMGCGNDDGCFGYELTVDLDFDTNADGTSTQPKPKDGTTGCVADADGKWPNDHADCDYDDYWNDGEGWLPIGHYTGPYSGTFDGNAHVINNLHILRDFTRLGLFTGLSGAVRDVGFTNADVRNPSQTSGFGANATAATSGATASSSVTPLSDTAGIGILAGTSSGTISTSYASGVVGGDVGTTGAGLLVGYNSGTISKSFTNGAVLHKGVAGGLVGIDVGGTISNTYSVGSVEGNSSGGLIGETTSTSITDSYATGLVKARRDRDAGGLVSYNIGGSASYSYWDTTTSEVDQSDLGDGMATSDLQTPESATGIYTDWDSDVWDFGAEDRYPALKADWDGDENPTVAEFGNQRPPRVPEVANAIPDQSIVTEGTVTINLETVGAAVFNELDGAELTYTVTSTNLSSGDDAIVEVTLAGTVITVTAGENAGKVEITVTASNPSDQSISDVFEVTVGKDYDAHDDNGLIEVSTLAQLNAIRWDLDGDGLVDAIEAGIDPDATDDDESYEAAFPFAISGMGCPSTGCGGYELAADLDFDTNEDGKVDQPKPKDGTTGCVADAQGNWPVDHPDCDYDDYWNGGKGWDPIGSFDALFSGTLVGNGKTISNLFINRAESDVGLIRRMSWSVYNMVLDQVNVTGSENTGGLVGFNTGTGDVYNSTVSGVVNGDINTGGLVGSNNGNIFSSYATGTVTGAVNTGGLVGSNIKDIHSSYATVAVTGAVNTGGLVGLNSEKSSVNGSYATGDVTGKLYVGGLVGRSNGDGTSINNSYAEGDVNGQTGVGGLVGSNQTKAKVRDSYSIGTVVGDIGTGELIGRYGPDGGAVERSFWVADTDDACDQTSSDGGTCKTTTDLQASLPTGWSTTVWDAGTATQYPALTADWDNDGNATVAEFGNQRPTTTTETTTSDD